MSIVVWSIVAVLIIVGAIREVAPAHRADHGSTPIAAVLVVVAVACVLMGLAEAM